MTCKLTLCWLLTHWLSFYLLFFVNFTTETFQNRKTNSKVFTLYWLIFALTPTDETVIISQWKCIQLAFCYCLDSCLQTFKNIHSILRWELDFWLIDQHIVQSYNAQGTKLVWLSICRVEVLYSLNRGVFEAVAVSVALRNPLIVVWNVLCRWPLTSAIHVNANRLLYWIFSCP